MRMIYRAVFHTNSHDLSVFSRGLSNVVNLLKAIRGEHYDLVLLFNGPGVKLLCRQDCGDHTEVIQTLQQARVSFKVCQNSLNMFGLTAEELVAGCEIVPAGIVALIELQHNGYAYIKP